LLCSHARYGDSDPITPEQQNRFPDNLSFVYRDYCHDSREEYERQLKHSGCVKTIFAGGMWKRGGWAAYRSGVMGWFSG